MKKCNRVLAFFMTIIMMVSGVVMIPAIGVSAATPSKYENKKLVKCGKYLFSAVYQADSMGYTIIRTTTSGKSKKTVVKDAENTNIYSNGNKVFYEKNSNVMYYNVKTKKSYTFQKNADIFGCCKKGVFTKTNVYGQTEKYTLKSFGGKTIKTIANNNSSSVVYSFIGSNSKYAFCVKSTLARQESYQDYYNSSIIRYTFSNKKVKVMKTVKDMKLQYYPTIEDSYVFDKYIVFTLGDLEGSGAFFNGRTYKMKKDGTAVSQITKEGGSWEGKLIQGKKCVYVRENNLNGSAKKITSSGKVSTVKWSSAEFSANGATLYTKENKRRSNSFDLYMKKGKSRKSLVSTNSVINSTDPIDAYLYWEIKDSVGKMVLATCQVYSYEGAYGWRPNTLRTNVYLVNTSTKKAIRID